jgi:hypothetical protein
MALDIGASFGEGFISELLEYCADNLCGEIFKNGRSDGKKNMENVRYIFSDESEALNLEETDMECAKKIATLLDLELYCYHDKSMQTLCIIHDLQAEYLASLVVKRDSNYVSKLLASLDEEMFILLESGDDSTTQVTDLLSEHDKISDNANNDDYAEHWVIFKCREYAEDINDGDGKQLFEVVKIRINIGREISEAELDEDGIVFTYDNGHKIYSAQMSKGDVFCKLCKISPQFRAEAIEEIISDDDFISVFTRDHFEEMWNENDDAEISPEWISSLVFSERFADVIISCGETGKNIYAHKLILAARSQYFNSSLYGTIAIPAVDGYHKFTGLIGKDKFSENTIRAILLYIYTGRIEFRGDNSVDNIREFILAADYLDVREIVDFAKNYVLN